MDYEAATDAGLRVLTVGGTQTQRIESPVGMRATIELDGVTTFTYVSPLASDALALSAATSPISTLGAVSVTNTGLETLFLAGVATATFDLASEDPTGLNDDDVTVGAGALQASATLDTINITTSGGADDFVLNEDSYLDAGNSNILTLNAGDGADSLTVNPATNVPLIQLSDTTVALGTDPAAAVDLGVVTLTGLAGETATLTGMGSTTFDVSGSTATATITGDVAGTNTLRGPNRNVTWNVAAGTVDTFTYTNIDNLVGGTGDDLFVFADGDMVASVDGGTGANTLDLSATTGALTVALTLDGTAVGFAGTAGTLAGTFDNITRIDSGSNAGDALNASPSDRTNGAALSGQFDIDALHGPFLALGIHAKRDVGTPTESSQ